MNLADSQAPMGNIDDVLASLRKKGVEFSSVNGQLHYKAPKGTLTQEEIERLRERRRQIVAHLGGASGVETAESIIQPGGSTCSFPLTFSQQARWRLFQSGELPRLRQVASATRLRGQLDLNALRRSIAHIVHRHSALRTRIAIRNEKPTQEIDEAADCQLEVYDLTRIADSLRDIEINRLFDEFILQPIDLDVGRMFGIRLLKLDDNEHILIAAMDHLISDGYSLSILTRDLFGAYAQASRGSAISLPAIPMQFADYASWQERAHKEWMEKHDAYWNERLSGFQRLRFPEDGMSPSAAGLGWGTIPLHIGKDLKAELRAWCRLRRTTLVMSVFTAYVALVFRWCNSSESVIQYQSDCRFSPQVENTIGFFSSVLYLRLALKGGDSLVDLMNRVTAEYCKSHEHADHSYIAAQVPRPEFTRNTVFNWVPQGSNDDLSSAHESEAAITCSPVSFVHPMLKKVELDREPGILLYDSDDDVVGGVYFPLNRFSVENMERFGRNFLVFIRALLRQPEDRVSDIVLV